MSNNKQSSVEWLIEQLKVCASSNFDYAVPHTEILIPTQVFESLFEQAKVMHKEEIINANWEASEDTDRAEQYYNETFKTD